MDMNNSYVAFGSNGDNAKKNDHGLSPLIPLGDADGEHNQSSTVVLPRVYSSQIEGEPSDGGDEEEEEEEEEEDASGSHSDTPSNKKGATTNSPGLMTIVDVKDEKVNSSSYFHHPEVTSVRENLLCGLNLVDTDSEGRATLLSCEPILRTLGFKDGDLDAILPERKLARKNRFPTVQIEEVVQRVLVHVFGPDLGDSLSSYIDEAKDPQPPPGLTKRRGLVASIKGSKVMEHTERSNVDIEVKRNLLDIRLASVMGNRRRVWSDGLARRLWDTVHLFAIVFLIIATSFYTYFLGMTDPTWMIIVSYVLHVFYAADILLSTQLAGFDFGKNQIVLVAKDIMRLRKKTLLIDLITVLPIDTMISHFFPVPPNTRVHDWSSPIYVFFAFFRWLQWSKFFRCFRLFEFTNVDFITPGHVDFFITNRPLLIGSGVSLLLMHFLICLYALTHPKRGVAYWMALVDTLSMITGSGPGVDIEASWAAQALAIVLIILAVLVQGLVIGQMSVIVFRADVKSANVQRMRETLAILEHYRVPQDTMREVLSYQMHALNDDADKTQSVLQNLPDAMRREIIIFVKVDAIHRVSLFSSASADSKIYLAKQLQRCIAPPLDDIVSIGDVGDEMFMISHGDADVIIVTGLTVAVLSRGDYFGEIALVTEQCTRQATVRALSYCDLWALSRDPFMDAVLRFPLLCEIVVNHMGTKAIDPNYFLKQVEAARALPTAMDDTPFGGDELSDGSGTPEHKYEELTVLPTVSSFKRRSLIAKKTDTPKGTTADGVVKSLKGANGNIEEDPEVRMEHSAPEFEPNNQNQSHGPLGEVSTSFRRTPSTEKMSETLSHRSGSSSNASSSNPLGSVPSARMTPDLDSELHKLTRRSSKTAKGTHRVGNASRLGNQEAGAFSVMASQRAQHGAVRNTNTTPWGLSLMSPVNQHVSETPNMDDLNQMATEEFNDENRELRQEVSILENRVSELVGYVEFFEREIYSLAQALSERQLARSHRDRHGSGRSSSGMSGSQTQRGRGSQDTSQDGYTAPTVSDRGSDSTNSPALRASRSSISGSTGQGPMAGAAISAQPEKEEVES